MRVLGTKCSSGRVACLGFFLVCATGVTLAQESVAANEAVSGNPAAAVAPATDAGITYNIPLVPRELQQPGTTAAAPASDSGLQGNFFERLAQFYKLDWEGKLPGSPTPPRRSLEAPLDSTPFPSADWGYGGSPMIGAPDGNVYPLMTALKLQDSRTKIYGWVAPSFNVSTSGKNNFPLTYDIFPNRIELNQAVI
jgi:hypothetical protein